MYKVSERSFLKKVFYIKKEEDLQEVVQYVLSHYPQDRFYFLKGSLGAGKTTLVKYFCKQLDVIHTPASPTFSVIHEYETRKKEKVYHMDLYRLKSAEELMDLGAEELFSGNYYIFVEWPECLEGSVSLPVIMITLEALPDGTRKIEVQKRQV